MMTEEEARTKWCPFARVIVVETKVTGNRVFEMRTEGVDLNPDTCRCIASECMMWRWEGRVDGHLIATERGHVTPSEAPGYCGLAKS